MNGWIPDSDRVALAEWYSQSRPPVRFRLLAETVAWLWWLALPFGPAALTLTAIILDTLDTAPAISITVTGIVIWRRARRLHAAHKLTTAIRRQTAFTAGCRGARSRAGPGSRTCRTSRASSAGCGAGRRPRRGTARRFPRRTWAPGIHPGTFRLIVTRSPRREPPVTLSAFSLCLQDWPLTLSWAGA